MLPAAHQVLPGELATYRAVGAVGYALGAIGGVALWLADPAEIRSAPVALATTVICFVMALVMATMPLERARSGWLLLPPLIASAVIAAAIENMAGGREVYEGFYLYIALAACYFLPSRQVAIVVGVIAVSSAVPLIGDASADSIVRWCYAAAGTATISVVIRSARRQVREHAAAISRLAQQDQLTGVLNRRGFEARAGQELSRARRHGEALSLLYIDLDGFKRVNDGLGHAAGDRVLRRVATGMAATLRGEDVLGRMGGDEFTVLLRGAPDCVSERLVAAVAAVAAAEPGAAHLGVTVAAATHPDDGETLDELMAAADARLIASKQARPVSAANRR